MTVDQTARRFSATRRAFLQGAAAAGLLTGCGRLPWQALDPPRVYRIGYLDPGSKPSDGRLLSSEEALIRGLRDLGYVEGQNLVVDYRYADQQAERLPYLASQLVGVAVEVIVAAGSAAPLAAKGVTSTVPIVMGSSSDPVGTGLIASLARPGGNVTGVANLLPQLSGKRVELLNDTLDGISSVAILWTAANPGTARAFAETQAAARSIGIRTVSLEARFPNPEIESLFETALREQAEALIVEQDPLLGSRFGVQIVSLAAAARLPTAYSGRQYVDQGGLMAYGANVDGMWYRAAYYVDRILKGTKPADLPVEQPREFELVINMRTAKALGLTIPYHVLLQATEVLE